MVQKKKQKTVGKSAKAAKKSPEKLGAKAAKQSCSKDCQNCSCDDDPTAEMFEDLKWTLVELNSIRCIYSEKKFEKFTDEQKKYCRELTKEALVDARVSIKSLQKFVDGVEKLVY